MRKQIGTEDGFGLVGYYVDPLEETEVKEITIEDLSYIVASRN